MTTSHFKKPSSDELDALWSDHNAQWRDPARVISIWDGATALAQDRKLLRYKTQGAWWETLAETGMTLLVSREYEHLVMALSVVDNQPHISYMKLPHPSGIAYDAVQKTVHIACTRNPNQIIDLKPVADVMPRLDTSAKDLAGLLQERPLVPVKSRFVPGCLYIHDLAMVDNKLYANSVGQNAVIRLYEDGRHKRVWWPLCIEQDDGKPVFGQNHLQLNSIAAGTKIENSFFSASTDKISARRPGHKNFPVDKRGVIFSGETRQVIGRGLTRPHSARLYGGHIWVDNSGYGELGYVEDGKFSVVSHLPGWTRGLAFYKDVAFVGSSCVIPRFRQYAPGLDVDSSLCGLHAVNTRSGEIIGSLLWPYGNQIFAVELVPSDFTTGFPFPAHKKRATNRERDLFYTFNT